jgi:hypothetical protein
VQQRNRPYVAEGLSPQAEVGIALLVDLRVEHLVIKVERGLRLEEHTPGTGDDTCLVAARIR